MKFLLHLQSADLLERTGFFSDFRTEAPGAPMGWDPNNEIFVASTYIYTKAWNVTNYQCWESAGLLRSIICLCQTN